MLDQFTGLAGDPQFWEARTDALAVFGSAATVQVIELQRPVEERVIVAARFHIKPLLRVLQSGDRYHVLCLTREEARLHEGNRDALDRIEINPDALTLDELRAAAWHVLEPVYLGRLAKWRDDYAVAAPRQLASDAIDEIARAAVAGRVGVLLVAADRIVPGQLDATGRIKPGDLTDPEGGDILDDLAARVLQTDGEVVILPAERLPTGTGIAAIFRY